MTKLLHDYAILPKNWFYGQKKKFKYFIGVPYTNHYFDHAVDDTCHTYMLNFKRECEWNAFTYVGVGNHLPHYSVKDIDSRYAVLLA